MEDCHDQCQHSDTALLAGFYLEGLALPLVGALGVVGNLLAILFLRSETISSRGLFTESADRC